MEGPPAPGLTGRTGRASHKQGRAARPGETGQARPGPGYTPPPTPALPEPAAQAVWPRAGLRGPPKRGTCPGRMRDTGRPVRAERPARAPAPPDSSMHGDTSSRPSTSRTPPERSGWPRRTAGSCGSPPGPRTTTHERAGRAAGRRAPNPAAPTAPRACPSWRRTPMDPGHLGRPRSASGCSRRTSNPSRSREAWQNLRRGGPRRRLMAHVQTPFQCGAVRRASRPAPHWREPWSEGGALLWTWQETCGEDGPAPPDRSRSSPARGASLPCRREPHGPSARQGAGARRGRTAHAHSRSRSGRPRRSIDHGSADEHQIRCRGASAWRSRRPPTRKP
jgi:hypothetical protein